jgi:hypothetical protein
VILKCKYPKFLANDKQFASLFMFFYVQRRLLRPHARRPFTALRAAKQRKKWKNRDENAFFFTEFFLSIRKNAYICSALQQ